MSRSRVPLCIASAVVALSFASAAAADARAAHRVPRPSGVITYTAEPADGAPTINLIRPDGTGRRTLAWPVDGAIISRISPDGRQVAAASFAGSGDWGSLRPAVSRIDGSRFRRLRVAGLPTNADVGPCIWAGNRALLCEVRSQAGSVDGIYRVDPSDLHAPVRLTATPYPPGDDFGGGDIPGDVSPDGTRFVFLRSIPVAPPTNPEATQSGALFVANIDGPNPIASPPGECRTATTAASKVGAHGVAASSSAPRQATLPPSMPTAPGCTISTPKSHRIPTRTRRRGHQPEKPSCSA